MRKIITVSWKEPKAEERIDWEVLVDNEQVYTTPDRRDAFLFAAELRLKEETCS